MMKSNLRLKRYIVKSHVDKPLEKEPAESLYNCPIQAGAALTDLRICDCNDHDGYSGSISDRNRRYCEATAIWWINAHADTPYVGIEHYRRRFDLSDQEIAKYMDQGVDLITTQPIPMDLSIEAQYRKRMYAADWKLFMEILKKRESTEEYAFACACFDSTMFHAFNINIFQTEHFHTFCNWVFPILDEFFERSPEKTDRYQKRDVGFICERLSHLFVMKMKKAGKRVIEAGLIKMSSDEWSAEKECDINMPEEVYTACNRLYKEGRITQSSILIHKAMDHGGDRDDRLCLLSTIFWIGQQERKALSETLYEYLPEELRSDLKALSGTFEGLCRASQLFLRNDGPEERQLLTDYVRLTRFSSVAARAVCEVEGVPPEDADRLLQFPVWGDVVKA